MTTILLWLLVITWLFIIINTFLTIKLIKKINALGSYYYKRPELEIGSHAPIFKLKTLAGQIITRNDYPGRRLTLVFISPLCSLCAETIRKLDMLKQSGEANADKEIILISEGIYSETLEMINGLNTRLIVGIAPRLETQFVRKFNPKGVYPYYCLIDEFGTINARGLLGSNELLRMQQDWASNRNIAIPIDRYT